MFEKTYWNTSPYALPFQGELSSISKLTSKTITTYFHSLLNPSNIIISIYGNTNTKELIKTITSHTQHLPPSTKDHKKTSSPEYTQTNTYNHTHSFETSTLFMGFKAPPLTNTKEKIKLDLIDAVLTGMSYPGGRLHNKLRDKGYVYMVHGINFSGLDTGSFYIYALSNPESINHVQSLILNEIKSLKTTLISNKELKEALERLSFYYKERIDSIENFMLIHAVDELLHNNFSYSSSIEPLIKTLDKQSIQLTAKKYLVNPQIFLFNPKIKTQPN